MGYDQSGAQILPLCGNADRAVICLASSHSQTANRLHSRIGNGDAISAQRQRLDKIGFGTQAASDDEGDSAAKAALVEMAAGAGQGDHRGDGDVVFEDVGGRAGAAAAPVKDDVIYADGEGKINVGFDVLSGEFEADRDAAGYVAYLGGDALKVLDGDQVGEGSRADSVLSFGQLAHLGNFADDFAARQMAAGAGFGPLSAFEVEGLHVFDFIQAPTKMAAG